MITNKLQNIAAALLLTVALGAPMSLKADDASPTPAASATPKAKKTKPTPPISGKVVSVDKAAKTFTVGKHTFAVADSTTFTGGTFDTLAVDAKVSVAYTKDGDKYSATSVTIKAAKTTK